MAAVDGRGGGRLVLAELGHIRELVRQLELHLAGSPDRCKHLASQISSLAERSIGMITSADGGRKRSAAEAGLASPLSAGMTPSPLSDVSDGPFKNAKKRKSTVETKRHQVRVSSPNGGETPVDDGHSWRKYGQKDILGAKHPRGYYRCTHRHSKGCQATKQVQRSDEDQTLFDVIYHGTHTCVQRAAPVPPTQRPVHNPDALGHLQSLGASLTVKTEGLADVPAARSAATPFGFCSTPASGSLAPERSPFAATSTSENWGLSPATSDSNHVFSFAPFDAQSEFQEVVSALVAASAPAPAMDGLDELLIVDGIDISTFFE